MNLPKTYLSYSQIELWHSDRWAYFRRYFHNAQDEPGPELVFGKRFAEVIEHYHKTGEALEGAPSYIDQLPRLAIAEHKIEHEISGVPILAYLDSTDGDLSCVIDYKTGAMPWDDRRVWESNQLKMYSLLAYERTGEIPEVQIVWLPTKKRKDGISWAGDTFHVFRHQFDLQSLVSYRNHILFTAREISAAWEAFQAEQDKVSRVAAILKEQKNLEEELAFLRADLVMRLEMAGADKMDFGPFKLFPTTRTTWKYSDVVKEAEARVKQLKAEEEEHGIAEGEQKTIWTLKSNDNGN